MSKAFRSDLVSSWTAELTPGSARVAHIVERALAALRAEGVDVAAIFEDTKTRKPVSLVVLRPVRR